MGVRISEKRAKELGIDLPNVKTVGKPNKFHAIRTEVNGKSFPSKLEGNRFAYLSALEKSGEIRHLRCQPRFILQPAFTDGQGRKHAQIVYTLDFEYWLNGNRILEEVKGKKTVDFAIRWKWFLNQMNAGMHGEANVHLVTDPHTPPGADTPVPKRRKRQKAKNK